MFSTDRRIHFVGIGGIGMSGIAEVLLNQGYPVSGSDLKLSPVTRRLEKLGAVICEGHRGENIGDAFVVVVSSAVSDENPEVVEAHRQMIPVIPRAEMLAELMRTKYGVAVAGTHGKTTTTSLIATLLEETGFDPTVVVGGKIGAMGSNAKLGQGRFMVAEADESDGSFLYLSPTVAVITNIDREHMDHYITEEAMEQAFVDFANKVPFFGAAIVCLDDPRVQEIMPRLTRRTVTYGLTSQADVWARNIERAEGYTRFEVMVDGEPVGSARVILPGKHNVLNSLAAFAVGLELGAEPGAIIEGIARFTGVDRRSQLKGESSLAMVFDDYAHHPTEIQAALSGLKEAYGKRVVAVFQPHRYSRTEDLLERFYTSFYAADILFVTGIYAAGEKPIEGVSAESLAEGIRQHGHRSVHHVEALAEVPDRVMEVLEQDDLVVTLGAGNVWQVGEKLLDLMKGGG